MRISTYTYGVIVLNSLHDGLTGTETRAIVASGTACTRTQTAA